MFISTEKVPKTKIKNYKLNKNLSQLIKINNNNFQILKKKHKCL